MRGEQRSSVIAAVGALAMLSFAVESRAQTIGGIWGGTIHRRYCPPPSHCPPGMSAPTYQGTFDTPQPSRDAYDSAAPSAPDALPPSASPTDQGLAPPSAPSLDNAQSPPPLPPSTMPGDSEPTRATEDSAESAVVLGRGDMANRFNLFDTMGAVPVTRAWFGVQALDGFQTGTKFTETAQAFQQNFDNLTFRDSTGMPITAPFANFTQLVQQNEGVTGDITQRQQQVLYRWGFEIAAFRNLSLAVQGQYHVSAGPQDTPDDFTNPQVLIKQVAYRNARTVISGLLGIQPQIRSQLGRIGEDTTRIYPGFLSYTSLTERLFTQGGFQGNIPCESNQVATVDWAASLGIWLYRDQSLLPGRRRAGLAPFIVGLAPRIELFGKHVAGDATVTGPFGLTNRAPVDSMGNTLQATLPNGTPLTFDQPIFIYEETRHVVDMTLGTQAFFRSGLIGGVGISFPLTGGGVRAFEVTSSVSYLF